jgi:CubicO group peptidase (beta-lactamase class C family)
MPEVETPESDVRFLARLLGGDFLLWSPNIQSEGFLHWDRIFATRTIPRGDTVRSYPDGATIDSVPFEAYGAAGDIDDLMAGDHLSGLLVVKNGEVRLERYAKGLTREGRWQSSSMVKSLASTLIGAAVHDGLIDIDRTVPEYLPDFAGTVYDEVTVRHLLTMTSGVEWTENTDDLSSDVAEHYIKVIAARRHGEIAAYLKTRARAAAPGTSYYYNTGDTFLLSLILKQVTGMTVSEYCSRKIWQPMGMEQDGFFMLDGDEPDGDEIIGSCCGASLRDYAKWGTLMIANGVANGRRILPEGWVETASTPQAANFAFDFEGVRGRGGANTDNHSGYGFLWWCNANGSFQALGSYGEWIHIDRAADLVVVMLGAIPRVPYMEKGIPEADGANSHLGTDRRQAFIDSVTALLA